MTDSSAQRLEKVDTETDSTPAAGPLKRVAQFAAPGIPQRTDESSMAEILEQFQKQEGFAEYYLAQARMRYDDVFKRAENVDGRVRRCRGVRVVRAARHVGLRTDRVLEGRRQVVPPGKALRLAG